MHDGHLVKPPSLKMIKLHDKAMKIDQADVRRQWMDMTESRFAYRCTPLNIANTSGWVFRLPISITAIWNGGSGRDAISISAIDSSVDTKTYVSSHFGQGILTFHLGWLLRTSPGWAIWARGQPNMSRPGLAPLDGIIEADWLNFPFTMNWRITEINKPLAFLAGEVVCWFSIFPHALIDQVTPTWSEIGDNPVIANEFYDWRDSRRDFNHRLDIGEAVAKREKWQKKYLHGQTSFGSPPHHVVKRTLPLPVRQMWVSNNETTPPADTSQNNEDHKEG